MSIYINKNNQNQESESDILKRLQSSLEFTTLGHLCLTSEIYYDPDYANTIIEDDVDVVNDYLAYPDEDDVDKL